MNRRLFLILIVAFVIALGCAIFVSRTMKKNLNASKPVATARIVAASGDVKLGSVLSSSNIKTIEIAGAPPKGAILKPESAIGRAALTPLYDGVPILDSQLAASGIGGGLAPLIPHGMRACAVRVDDVVGVAGFVTPGMRVDVVAIGNPSNNAQNTGPVARTILQNIQVLSAGSDFQKDSEGKAKQVQVVNVLVTPDQAQTLTLATAQAVKIQLILRNPLDTKVEAVKGTGMNALFNGASGASEEARPKRVREAAPAPQRSYSIEIINGAKKSEQSFTESGGRR